MNWLKEFNSEYMYCPWHKFLPKWFKRKFNRVGVGVWLLNLNHKCHVVDKGSYWLLKFFSCEGQFHFSKKEWKIKGVK